MRRRDFFLAATVVAGGSPTAALQPPTHARIGWLAYGDTMPRRFFEEALAQLGWAERKNLTIERRFAGSAGEQMASAAAELVAWHPDVIVAMGTIDAKPVLALTRTIAIVVVTSADGLSVARLHRGRWAALLRTRHQRQFRACRRTGRQNPARR